MKTEVSQLDTIKSYTKKVMLQAHSAMKSDEESSYYVADDVIDKLDKMITAYGKKTHSSFINHRNFVAVRISNGIVNMQALRNKIEKQLDNAKKNSNVNKAIKATKMLDHINMFDFKFKYGEDTWPANNFYNGDKSDREMPQLDASEVIKDVINGTTYTVGPDVVYLFLLDFRNNVLD